MWSRRFGLDVEYVWETISYSTLYTVCWNSNLLWDVITFCLYCWSTFKEKDAVKKKKIDQIQKLVEKYSLGADKQTVRPRLRLYSKPPTKPQTGTDFANINQAVYH